MRESAVVEARDPSTNRVIQAGITNENEAEKLARGTSGDQKISSRAARKF
jgi:hypothetical protein